MTATIVACNGAPGGNLPATPFALHQPGASAGAKIQHVIVVIQENRSFDNFFATFPGADGTLTGKAAPMPSPLASSCASEGMQPITKATTLPLAEVPLEPKFQGQPTDIDHNYSAFSPSYDHGNMDGFDLIHLGASGEGLPACTYVYQYVNPKDVAPYWDMAKQYVLADHTFQVQGSGSFTAHQDLIAAGTDLNSSEALIDNPSYFPWGCDARTPNPTASPPIQGVVTAVIKRDGKVYEYGGPFPCLTYKTMRDLLDAKKVSWKFYAMKVNKWFQNDPNSPGIWSAFDAIKAVRYSKEWNTNVTRSSNDILTDIAKKQLPSVAWVTPDSLNSDHPGMSKDTGPSWVASIVNAVGQSSYWKSTAIVVVWDDWGGLYDHVSPPTPRDWEGGPGFRIPMLIVSPYVKPHVDSTVYEFGSILRFIEENWSLGTLGRNDAHATSIRNAFDFKMPARSFKVIPAKYSREFFLHQKPSGLPPDTE